MVSPEQLESLHIFRGISRKALEGLARDMVLKTYSPGETVIKEGSLGGTLFLIGQGMVSVQKSLGQEGERAKVVARLGTEEFFGEMSFLENKPHSATVIAEEKTEIFVLPRESLAELIKEDPRFALEQILTLLSGVSSRLRSTTRELVTVFAVARLVAAQSPVEELFPKILRQIQGDLGTLVTVAFYRWNQFNDEFSLVAAEGPAAGVFNMVKILETASLKNPKKQFEEIPDVTASSEMVIPFSMGAGHLIISHSAMEGTKDGLFFYYHGSPSSFTPGQRQLMETISAVLAPALATARTREEEILRQRLERGRQGQGFSI